MFILARGEEDLSESSRGPELLRNRYKLFSPSRGSLWLQSFLWFKLMLCATSPLASCVCVYEWMNVSRILPPPLGHQRTLNPGCFNYSSMRSAHLRLPSSTCSENLIFRLMSLNFLHFFHGISDQIWNEARPCEKSFNLNGQGENTIWDGGVDKKNLWLGGNNLVFSALRSGNAPLTCSYENQKYALVFVFGVFFSEAKELPNLSPSPSLPISGEEEMEGVGVGQRPEGGNQKDYHKFTWSKLSVSYAVSLEICVE